MHSLRTKITAVTIAEILISAVALDCVGILALKTESDRSSTQEMSLICTNTQMLLDGDFTVELDYKGNDEVGVLTGSLTV
ncbi:MAG: hypothetical protein IJH94_03750 [Clostridia bacterium]|nr:hypothetical protein [Clostridia bacterium]